MEEVDVEEALVEVTLQEITQLERVFMDHNHQILWEETREICRLAVEMFHKITIRNGTFLLGKGNRIFSCCNILIIAVKNMEAVT